MSATNDSVEEMFFFSIQRCSFHDKEGLLFCTYLSYLSGLPYVPYDCTLRYFFLNIIIYYNTLQNI